jgi:hypothetical protein
MLLLFLPLASWWYRSTVLSSFDSLLLLTTAATTTTPNDATIAEPVASIKNTTITTTRVSSQVSSSHKHHNDSSFQPVCLTKTCLEALGKQFARAFPKKSIQEWCTSSTRTTTSSTTTNSIWQGLLHVKVPKAASSTTAGVVLRIHNHTHCAVEHVHRLGYEYKQRNVETSFLVASLRDPAERALSAVYYFVLMPQLEQKHQQQLQQSTTGRNTTVSSNTTTTTPFFFSDNTIIRSLHTKQGGKTRGKGGYMYNYLSLKEIPPRSVWTPLDPLKIHSNLLQDLQTNVLQEYNFLMVVERLEESLVVLALLTGLSLQQLLVASAKQSGSYILARIGRTVGICQRKQRYQVSSGVQAYLESPEWLWMNYADYVLHSAANASLDRTIDETIGRHEFDEALKDYKRLQQHVIQYCGEERLGSGCTQTGETILPMEDCYENDL